MTDEIQVIADEEGMLLLGDAAALDLFIEQESLTNRPVTMEALRRAGAAGGAAAEAAALVAESSGRWVKLTEQSARLAKAGALRTSKASGNSTGVLTAKNGQVTGFVEFVKAPAATLANPAALAGVGALMTQLAMQQAMDEIADYLTIIDAKVDDVLRAQKDAAIAELLGVGLVLDEAIAVRESVGCVSEVTWSKVAQAPLVIASAQSYSLRRLQALAEKLEKESKVGDLAALMGHIDAEAREWLGVLARSFQLADAVAVLELDRVLALDAESLQQHRAGLAAARQRRLSAIETETRALLERIQAVAELANDKVLLNPRKAPAVVASSAHAASAVTGLRERLALPDVAAELEARTWKTAAVETREHIAASTVETVDAARDAGGRTLSSARSAATEAARRLKTLRKGRD